MNPRVKKIVLVIQDVIPKDSDKPLAVLFGDIHLKEADKEGKSTVSFTMALSNNKDVRRILKDMVADVLIQNNEEIKQKSPRSSN